MGTRFRLFAQSPFVGFGTEPEIVAVSSPPGSVGAGPSDGRMFVIEPVGKKWPYGMNRGPLGTPFVYLPQWRGPRLAPALPDDDGNFDYLEPDMPGFAAAHAFGSARFTLDVWENYLGEEVDWHFRDDFDRLEISILPQWDNARFGYGFLEIGSQFEKDGSVLPFALDFDIIAHEVGHAFIFSILGVPDENAEFPEYGGFHESFSDCVSLIAEMHFPSVIDQVLDETSGNLYLSNRIARFSEFPGNRQIRDANNTRTMDDFVDGYRNEHDLSEPLTGAIFDILADIFQESLVDRGLISREVEQLAEDVEFGGAESAELQHAFDSAYADDSEGFAQALADARDVMGAYLAETLWDLDPDFLDYGDVADVLLAVDERETDGRYGDIIERNFERRGIGVVCAGPRFEPKQQGSLPSQRAVLPRDRFWLPRMSYRERFVLSESINRNV
ncbi:hypothetical protein [Mesorhizobium sp. KR9-304]|uniref:hypothetical protein n=1 Tax=Mesorhizobium sp. KR9-304 TaxID=3156614 RepID=UPI0032B49A78